MPTVVRAAGNVATWMLPMTGDAFLTKLAWLIGQVRADGRLAPILDQPFDPGTLQALRAAVRARARQAGLPAERAGDMVLAVHELAANAIRHGAGRGRLRMWNLAEALSCEVLDGGRSLDSGPALNGDAPAPDGRPVTNPWPAVYGHGLWLVRRVADQMEVLSGPHGTRALVAFALQPGGSHPLRWSGPRPT